MTAEPRDDLQALIAKLEADNPQMKLDRHVVGKMFDYEARALDAEARLAAGDRENAELRGEVERLEARLVRADEARRRIERARDDACTKVGRVELMHVWTNEDGRRFVFADDLAKALGLPV